MNKIVILAKHHRDAVELAKANGISEHGFVTVCNGDFEKIRGMRNFKYICTGLFSYNNPIKDQMIEMIEKGMLGKNLLTSELGF